MLRIYQILVSTIVLAASTVGMTACGQAGALYLPTEPAAANRATLPEILRPGGAAAPVPPAATMPSPTPVPTSK